MRVNKSRPRGKKFQAQCRNFGVLSVQVPDATWRAQLLGLAPQYVAAVNKFVSQNVKKISFILPHELVALRREQAERRDRAGASS